MKLQAAMIAVTKSRFQIESLPALPGQDEFDEAIKQMKRALILGMYIPRTPLDDIHSRYDEKVTSDQG